MYVRISKHTFFERHGQDLICRVPISFTQAALGANVDVPSLGGPVALKIPAGTQHGQMFRLGGKGLPSVRSSRRGDEIVQVWIEVPRKLNKKQEQLLRDFAKTEDKAVLPESRSFFEKVAEFFAGSKPQEPEPE